MTKIEFREIFVCVFFLRARARVCVRACVACVCVACVCVACVVRACVCVLCVCVCVGVGVRVSGM